MAWHVNLFNVLTTVNNVVLIIIGIPFILQFIFMFLFWLPKKKFPKSEKQNRICVIIPAHNEADVIYDTVKRLFDLQQYPRELFDVYVVAHNCTDNTKELATQAGAIALELNDPDPKHRRAAYPLQYGLQQILATEIAYDFVIRLDADNHINDAFFSLMNDAYNAGCQMARPYESTLNITQNRFTKACGLYYAFDSRFSSRAREFLHLDAHVSGPGAMISYQIIKKIGGYDCTSITEDSEFCFKRLTEGYRCHFVEDAIVYEDLPSTFSDTLCRNRRIAAGSLQLWLRSTPQTLWCTVRYGRLSFLEFWATLFMVPICVVLCTWIPFFYVYDVAYLWANGLFTSAQAAAFGVTAAGLLDQLQLIGIILLVLFVVMGIGQGLLLVTLESRKLGATKRRDLIDGAFLYPLFTVVYCLTMCLGAFMKPKWQKVNRNKTKQLTVAADPAADPVPASDVPVDPQV